MDSVGSRMTTHKDHKELSPNKSISKVNKEVEEPQKTLNKMAEKIVHLEIELEEIKLKEKEGVKFKAHRTKVQSVWQ